jgi:hypothetical protein
VSTLPNSLDEAHAVSIRHSNRKRPRLRDNALALLLWLIPTCLIWLRDGTRAATTRPGCTRRSSLRDTWGRSALIARRLQAFRQTRGRPVSKETLILDNPLSPRGVALLMVKPAQSRTREQTAYIEQLIQSDATVAAVFKLAQDFGWRLAKARGAVASGAMESRCPGQWDCGTDRFCRWVG